MKIFSFHLGLLFLLAFQPLYGQELFPIQNFSPNDYQAETQNWGIAQGQDKSLYIANNQGLLVFNRWAQKRYPSPNNSIMRSVYVSGKTLYTGCYMEFGFWEKDSCANLHYTSLSQKIKDQLLPDEHFWKIIGYQQWILFQSLNRIYIYDTLQDCFNIVKSDQSITKLYEVSHQILYQESGKGLFRLEKGKGTLLSNHPVFKNEVVVNIFEYGEGYLCQTLNKGFFLLSNDNLTPWATDPRLTNLSIYCSLRLQDGCFVLGTIGEGCYILSSEGNIISHLERRNGLLNNTVLSLFEDIDQNIWLGLDNGLSVVNYKSPYRVYSDVDGVFGTVYASALHQGHLYLGTNQGLYVKTQPSTDEFKLIQGTQGQVWTLQIFDNQLFCGHNSGTFIVSGNQAKLIADKMGTWVIEPIADQPQLLLQGNYEGLNVLEKSGGTWHYRNTLEGFDISSRYLVLRPDHQLFVNHELRGLYQLTLSDDYRKVLASKKMENVPLSANSGIVALNNRCLYFSESGLYAYDTLSGQFVLDESMSHRLLEDDLYVSGKMLNQDNAYLWFFTRDNVIALSAGKISEEPIMQRIALPLSIRENRVGYENLVALDDERFLLGTNNGYIIMQPNRITDDTEKVQLVSVEKSKKNYETAALPIDGHKLKIKSNENNIRFTFTVPVFERITLVKYQYQLAGMYEQWSEWSQESWAQFNNLPSGQYTFKVRAKVGNQPTDNVVSYSFYITRPWYSSRVMLGVYLVLVLALLRCVHHIYCNRIKRISERNERGKKLLQLQNEQEIIKLKNQNLNQEVASKNRELVSSTMAVMEKTELLKTIRQQLQQESSNGAIRSTVNIIDRNMEKNRDWEALQEAFNLADRDFLTKLKALHPTLTPNDLKLCVYLRLNLSSKEIAPLLSISPQSVEIKRSRLRKKLALKREVNLTEYIMSI